jgi:L-threonylcarbamoyladenylate synthase
MNKKKLQVCTWNDPKTIKALFQSVKNNKISITSTDTVLGLLANITQESFTMLNSIKKERHNKPYLILIDSLKKLPLFIQIENLTPILKNLLSHCWPGPVSIIFQAKKSLPAFLQTQNQTIALRCPKHIKLQKILSLFPGLFSTSANTSGATIPKTLHEIDPNILAYIEYVILDQSEDTNSTNTVPISSTIIDISHVMKEGPQAAIQVIREGQYPIKELERIYGNKFKR